MKCLNQLCNEQVSVGNYCPTHAISAGKVYRNFDEDASQNYDYPSNAYIPMPDPSDGVASGGDPGDDVNDGAD